MSQAMQDLIDLETEEDGEQSTDYKIDYSIPDNEMRIQHCDPDGVICYQILNAAEAYTFAHKILRAYDKLEGI